MKDKREIYKLIVEETGIPRSTVRRIAGDLRKEIQRKIRILTDEDTLKRIMVRKTDAYMFIPEKIRMFWLKKTKKDFVLIKCEICKVVLGYVLNFYDGNLICRDCQFKFPEASRLKKK